MRVLLPALAALLLAAAPASAAPTWLTPVTLSPQTGGEVQNATIASAPGGQLAAVWMKQTGSAPLRYTAQLALRPPGGGFGPVINVSQASEQYTALDVAVDGTGTATVVWNETIGGVTEVKAMRVTPDGTKTGAQTLAATGDEPRVAVNAGGVAVATWREQSQIHAAVRGAATEPFTDVGPISPTASLGIDPIHDVAIDPAGNAVAAWIRDNTKVEANARPAGGSFKAPAAADPIQDAGDANNLALAMAPGGQATLMWTHPVPASEVRTAERTASPSFAAGGWNPADRASPMGQTAQVASVALDAQNTAIGVWQNTTTGKVEAGIRSSGGSFTNFTPLSGSAGSFFSRVDVAPDGSAVAIWRGSSGGKPAIQAVRRSPGGDFGGVADIALGDPAPADPVVDFFNASVAVDDEGNAAAIWTRFRQNAAMTINDFELDAAGFDVAPPAFAAVSIPGSGAPGAPLGMAAAATDRWSPIGVAWSFGDGATGTGSAVSHAFGSAGAFDVTVTATDAVGNSVSATRPVLIAAPPVVPPPFTPRIDSTVQSKWGFDRRTGKRFYLFRLKVVAPPAGSVAQLRCRGKRCPFQSRRFTRIRKKAITLYKLIDAAKVVKQKNRRFRAGQTVQLRITAPGYVGKVVKYRLKRRKQPIGRVLCLPPGATKPSKC
jgi:hypothetical protein